MPILTSIKSHESAGPGNCKARWMCWAWLVFMAIVPEAASQKPQTELASLWHKTENQSLMSDSARYYLEVLIERAEKEHHASFEAEGHYLLGKHFFLLMQDDLAIRHFRKARSIFAEQSNREKTGFSNVQLGLSFIQRNQLDSALLSFQAAIKIYNEHDLLRHLWTPYMGISSVYQKEGNIPAAFKYGLMSTEALRHTQERTGKLIALNHVLSLARENDSLRVFAEVSDQLIKLYSPLEMDSRVIQHIDHFVEIGDPHLRIGAIRKSIEQLEEWPATLELISSYYQLGQSYTELENLREAIRAFDKAYSLEKDHLKAVHFAPVLLRSLSELYEKQGQYEAAISYHKKYASIRDSLQQQFAKARTEELQMQFETQAKDQQIAEQQLTVDKRTIQRNSILGLVAFLLLTGGYVFYVQRRHMRDQRIIAEQQDVLYQKEISELKKKHELTNLQTLINAQEEERSRMAQDLHDSLGSLLLSIKMQSRKLQHARSEEEVSAAWQMHFNLLDTVSAEARRIAHNIMPPALSRMGLSAALEDLANTIQMDHQLDVAFQNIDYDHSLEYEKEITLYRIAQELCSNVIRHAEANQLLIQLSRHNGTVTLVVEDNGKGLLVQDQATPQGGMGLESIKSRVGLLKGEMEILASPGEGTSFTIQMPVL